MIKINFCGKELPCLEHMKEIKETDNGELFNKFYNKKQFFNFFLNKDQRKIDGEKTVEPINDDYEDDFGIASGLWVYSGSWCATVELFKLENLDKQKFKACFIDDDFWSIKEENEYNSSFFVKDDDGQIWFVYTDVD